MQDTPHTPGPWRARRDISGTLLIEGQHERGGLKPIVTVRDWSATNVRIPHEESEANARLIAIAPELLDFVEQECLCFNRHYATEPNCGICRPCQAMALVARARGEAVQS